MSTDPNRPRKPKAKYSKPAIRTESLTAVAAVCNGTSTAGRKASTTGGSPCSASKLKS